MTQIFVLIEMVEGELKQIKWFSDINRPKAENLFNQICEQGSLIDQFVDDELPGTLRIAGDDVHNVQLLSLEPTE
jgi:hypothetical protein